jgi:hypothetical protein
VIFALKKAASTCLSEEKYFRAILKLTKIKINHVMVSQLDHRSSTFFKLKDSLDSTVLKNKDQIKLIHCLYTEKGYYSLLIKCLNICISLTLKQLGNVKEVYKLCGSAKNDILKLALKEIHMLYPENNADSLIEVENINGSRALKQQNDACLLINEQDLTGEYSSWM